MDDQVEAVEVLHNEGTDDLHFRYIGTAKGRQFVLNVQFDSADGYTGDVMLSVEHGFMITKILGLVMERLGVAPNPGLH
jgi:hypothetical protein